MTVIGDQIIRQLELGDVFISVTDKDRADAADLLKADPQIDATIAYLERKRVLGTLLARYRSRRSPSLFDLTMNLAARVTAVSAGMIEVRLRHIPYFAPEGVRLTSRLGLPTFVFRMANDLSINLARHGVVRRAGVCTTEPAPSISTSPSASFTGSGATGRNIFTTRMPAGDQVRVAWEQANHSGEDPRMAGPVSRRYGNPLIGLRLPGSGAERKAQAGRVACLPTSSLFSAIYINGVPPRSAVFAAAARLHQLTPEIIGGVILAEQRDQSRNEDMLDYTAATHPVARRTTSVGLGQIRDDTAVRHDLYADLLDGSRRSALSRRQIATLMTCDEFNIFACARYIRWLADQAVGYSAATLPKTVAEYPGVNFAAYGGNGSTWPADNVAALANEYTSKPWDDRLRGGGWGHFAKEAWNDMNAANILW